MDNHLNADEYTHDYEGRKNIYEQAVCVFVFVLTCHGVPSSGTISCMTSLNAVLISSLN